LQKELTTDSSKSSSRITGWGFAGLFHHEPSGLDLATYRLYDPKQRRFISRDPLGEAVDYNVYRYGGNNPVNFVDPSGLEPYADPGLMDQLYPTSTLVNGVATFLGSIPEFDQSQFPDVTVINGASSSEAIQALESSEVVIITGHHYNDTGEFLFADGKFSPNDIVAKAKKLPEILFWNGCNTSESLPSSSDYPGTTFIGLDGYIKIPVAARQALQALGDIQGGNLPQRVPGAPTMTVVGQPPSR